ncbi:1,3-beta-D-glucan synthase [Dinochytrium kinnereticum]|nr:1,3-beta-D-glucan synthase [Dinochytrium kinnereticum]
MAELKTPPTPGSPSTNNDEPFYEVQDVEKIMQAMRRRFRGQSVLLMQELGGPLVFAVFALTNYGVVMGSVGAVIGVGVAAVLPIALNGGMLLAGFFVSVLFGNTLGCCLDSNFIASFMSSVSRIWALLSTAIAYVSLTLLNRTSPSPILRTLLSLISFCAVQNLLLILITLFLTREPLNTKAGMAWWNGRWLNAGLGWRVLTQPVREYFCKITEMVAFGGDFCVVVVLNAMVGTFILLSFEI